MRPRYIFTAKNFLLQISNGVAQKRIKQKNGRERRKKNRLLDCMTKPSELSNRDGNSRAVSGKQIFHSGLVFSVVGYSLATC